MKSNSEANQLASEGVEKTLGELHSLRTELRQLKEAWQQRGQRSQIEAVMRTPGTSDSGASVHSTKSPASVSSPFEAPTRVKTMPKNLPPMKKF